MSQPIYLDYAATTPVDPRVASTMMKYLTLDGVFGNPASRSHRYGWQAEEAVDEARHCVAELIHADPREIVFTSGATESNNLALKGVAQFHQERGRHIITLATEHKAVLDACEALEQQGFDVTYLAVKSDGRLDLETLKQAIQVDTILVSVMHVNNETGVVQDIPAIAKICHAQNVLLHVDAAQSVGKIPVNVNALGADLLSISAHKMYGPKGVGALYVRRTPRVHLAAQIHGGGHERGMRSGTLATHQIVGLGEAARYAVRELEAEAERLTKLRDNLWQALKSLGGVTLNGSDQDRAPGILNLSFDEVEGELLLMSLNQIAVSSGSACNSATVAPSYVLRALGVSTELAHSSIRLSVGRFTTDVDVAHAAQHITDVVTALRQRAAIR
ncbi:MAG: IscS subfamily cysteine desulfurase [Idiomarina sp.]|nr:IscS subfamily cysteine desulfurase [Idiomarina sp.]